MTRILSVQLLTSFIVGGTFITILSLFAERANQRIAGIIMMFPTTLVLGFFFLGLTTSAQNVSTVIPATLIPLGIVIFSSVIYIYCALFYERKIKNKKAQILLTLFTSIVLWFILASPFAIYKYANFIVGLLGFLAITTLTHFIFQREKTEITLNRPKYTPKQILLRATFTGTIIMIVVFLGKTLNPFWGGIFTMFPAATFATLTILHFYYAPKQLFYFVKNAPIGSISLFIYAISVMLLFPILGIWLGTLVSYIISMSFGLFLIRHFLKIKG